MKRIANYTVLAVIFAAGFWATACSDQQQLMYDLEKPGVYFYEPAGNTSGTVQEITGMDYSFVVSPPSVTSDTLEQELRLRIIGNSAPEDRVINLTVADSSTAERGVQFDYPDPVIMPADSFEVFVPVYVYRTPNLKSEVDTVYFTIEESEDFAPEYDANLQHYITITDSLTPPPGWPGFPGDMFYGQYSRVKHEFVVQTLGTTNITFVFTDPESPTLSQMGSFQQQLRIALAEYEAENGPMFDENGNRVIFP